MQFTDLNAVQAFVKVIEQQSFRAAALALGVPKSTLSRKVTELEDALGTRLLERTTRSMRLTDAGSAYYRRVGPALDALHEAERAVEQLGSEPSGPLRLTMTVDGGQTLLGPILSEYMELYPNVELDVELDDRRLDLIEHGFDLALRAGTLADSTLIAKKLGPIGHLQVYASVSYLQRRGVPRHPRDLAKHDCLLMSSQSQARRWAFEYEKRPIKVEVHGRAQANSFRLLAELCLAGHGVTRLPCYLADEAVKAGVLKQLLKRFNPEPSPWHAVYPSSRNLSPKVRALVALLEKRFGASKSG